MGKLDGKWVAGYSYSTKNKNVTPNVSPGNNDDTGIAISETPFGYVEVLVNGRNRDHKTFLGECYFSNAGEVTFDARSGLTSNLLRSDGSVWSWGSNGNGECADGTANNSRTSPVSAIGDHSFIALYGGNGTVIALKENGEYWGWGYNDSGSIGNGEIAPRSSPISAVQGGHSFVDIVSGATYMHGLKDDGTVWGWGLGNFGNVGDGTVNSRSSPVSVLGGHNFVQISSSCGRKADGRIWTWGYNVNGGLGDGTISNRSSPVSVLGDHSFVYLVNNASSAAGLKADGTVWTWGNNTVGMLGDGTTNDRSSPVSVLGGHSFVQLMTRRFIYYGLKADGTAWSWGHNNNDGGLGKYAGMLADNTIIRRSSPVSVVGDHSFVELLPQCDTGFSNFMTAKKSDQSIWGWGTINNGTSRSSPVIIVEFMIHHYRSPRSINSVVQGDILYWNRYYTREDKPLTSADRIDVLYKE